MAIEDKFGHFWNFNSTWESSIGSTTGIPTDASFETGSPIVGSGSVLFVDGSVSYGPGNGIFTSGAKSVTICFQSNTNTDQYIFCCDSPKLGLFWRCSDSKFWVQGSGVAQYVTLAYDANKHQVTFTDDGAAGYTIYMDGTSRTIYGSDTLIGDGSNDLTIGEGYLSGQPFKGLLDAFGIANQELVEADALELYNGGDFLELYGTPPPPPTPQFFNPAIYLAFRQRRF